MLLTGTLPEFDEQRLKNSTALLLQRPTPAGEWKRPICFKLDALPFARTISHPRFKTPVNSIMLVGAASFGIASLSLIGVGHAEAFQLLFNASGIFYALTYVVMFAIPLFGLRTVTPCSMPGNVRSSTYSA